MATLRTIDSVKGTVSTTDGATWTTLATYTLASNASFLLRSISVLGKDGSGVTASAQSTQAGKRVAGTISMVGTFTSLISIVTGSEAALSTSDHRIDISVNDIRLQVKGVAATTIEWIGSFDILIH